MRAVLVVLPFLLPAIAFAGRAPAPGARIDAGADAGIPALPLLVRVAREADAPVVDAAWIDARVAEANVLLGVEGIAVRERAREELDAPLARLETRADRDAIARLARPGVVNVFVVALLRDVDDGVQLRRGVHWRLTTAPQTRVVILSALAGEAVLAHELGHYLGLPHTRIDDDVMSYGRDGGPLAFRAAQGPTLRAGARAAFASRELAPE